MTCTKCGDDNSSASAKFCEGCGHPFIVLPAPVVAGMACTCDPATSAPDAEGFCDNCGVRCALPSTANAHHSLLEVNARLAMSSDVGRRHTCNEDCGYAGLSSPASALLVVADGVSTSYNASGASALAIEQLKASLTGGTSLNNPELAMRNAIMDAHRAIISLPAGDNPKLDEPESTVVAALVTGDVVTIGWVGDSRAYLIGDKSERCLTVDDSWVEEVVANGSYTREAASVHKFAHCITQVLGMRDDVITPHTMTTRMAADEMLLLCSDGLWNYFQQNGSLATWIHQLKHSAREPQSASAICEALVSDANAAGGHDNITVAVLLGGG
ncbi:PP2C family protein-serine/threonine phosphatase [Undibacterium sp. JH2W]|uniref:PP2C family protein-serine/threonine phosphatase n=1 Tax=Undibacterium sp. JH2W TaxID=3413037 RepID=UPI003BF346AB